MRTLLYILIFGKIVSSKWYMSLKESNNNSHEIDYNIESHIGIINLYITDILTGPSGGCHSQVPLNTCVFHI